jgi:OHCU decarboxylase
LKTQVYKQLAWLNELAADEAEAAFLDCCGSREWARRMAAARPFRLLTYLFETGEEIWFSLPTVDQLEAFAAHPRIGSTEPADGQKARAATWSAGEQSAVATAADDIKKQLAEANALYADKFGFIFIVCATGKSADEMLAICKARLRNSAETELKLAAIEQWKITEIRLNKLLES